MANAIVALILVGFLLTGLGALAQSSFKSMDMISDAWKGIEHRADEKARVDLSYLSGSENPPQWDVTIKNTGSVSLSKFEKWDVIVMYYRAGGRYEQKYLPYTVIASPGDDQWTVKGIYLNAGSSTPEIQNKNIFDPGEEMVIRLKLTPQAFPNSTHFILIGTYNGVTVSGNI